MSNYNINGKVKSAAIVASTLAALYGCSSNSNPVSSGHKQVPNNKDAILSLDVICNDDSAYCAANVSASKPCSVYVDLVEGTNVVKDSAVYFKAPGYATIKFGKLTEGDRLILAYTDKKNKVEGVFRSATIATSGTNSGIVGGVNDSISLSDVETEDQAGRIDSSYHSNSSFEDSVRTVLDSTVKTSGKIDSSYHSSSSFKDSVKNVLDSTVRTISQDSVLADSSISIPADSSIDSTTDNQKLFKKGLSQYDSELMNVTSSKLMDFAASKKKRRCDNIFVDDIRYTHTNHEYNAHKQKGFRGC